MAAKKKKRTVRVKSNPEQFLDIIQTDDAARKKLYEKFGRVRCYLYKTGRSKPNEDTAKIIQKLTGNRIAAANW